MDPTELVELRTVTVRTVDNHDGTLTTSFFTDPVFYQPDGATAYEPIEPLFTADARTKAVASTKAPVSEALAPDGSVALKGNDVAITLTPLQDGSDAESGDSAPVPTAEGPTAEVENAFPGVDLRVIARATGTATFLVLHEVPADPAWMFALDAPGLVAALTESGAVEFIDASGKVVGRCPRPTQSTRLRTS